MGHFRTRDGIYCYPLTVADQHNALNPLLGCHGLLSTKARASAPSSIASFAITAAARHSHRQRRALRHHRHPRPVATQRVVDPAGHSASADPARQSSKTGPRTKHRDAQGRHARPRRAHLPAQQRAFNRFRRPLQRRAPHKFLGAGRPPRSTSRRSPITRVASLRSNTRPYIPKRVGTNAGTIRLHKRLLFIANSLKQHVPRSRKSMMGFGPSTSAMSSWPASMNATTYPRVRRRRLRFRGYHGMATPIIIALTGQHAMRYHAESSFPKALGQHPTSTFSSVTHVPG